MTIARQNALMLSMLCITSCMSPSPSTTSAAEDHVEEHLMELPQGVVDRYYVNPRFNISECTTIELNEIDASIHRTYEALSNPWWPKSKRQASLDQLKAHVREVLAEALSANGRRAKPREDATCSLSAKITNVTYQGGDHEIPLYRDVLGIDSLGSARLQLRLRHVGSSHMVAVVEDSIEIDHPIPRRLMKSNAEKTELLVKSWLKSALGVLTR